MITIIDTQIGNVKSVHHMLTYLGVVSEITSNKADIETAEKIILPGVGSFDAGIEKIYPLMEVLSKKVLSEQVPFLGICLGMQLMCKSSDEGKYEGLGWFDIHVKKLEAKSIPHLGWAYLDTLYEPLQAISGRPKFYFAHSYCIPVSKETVARTYYDGEEFSAIIQKSNILGVQFHPEKSHEYGMHFLDSFSRL